MARAGLRPWGVIESGGQNTLGPRLSPPGPAAAAPSVEQGLESPSFTGFTDSPKSTMLPI